MPRSTRAPSATGSADRRPAARPDREKLIVSVQWVTRGGRRSLAVEPSAVQRANPSLTWGEAGWRQVLQRDPSADRPGMREQYICHAMFAATKARFFLEPWRPAKSLASTIAEGCNPGPRKDLG